MAVMVCPAMTVTVWSAGAVHPSTAVKDTVCCPEDSAETVAPPACGAPPSTDHCAPAAAASAAPAVPAIAPIISEPAPPVAKVSDVAQPQLERTTESGDAEPSEHTRLHMNIGEVSGVVAGDITALISGETGLPAQVVSKVDIRERHLFVEVASTYANGIIAKLNRAQLKGRKLKQREIAPLLSIPQPKVSALKNYRLDQFSVEKLMEFLTVLNQDVEIMIRPHVVAHEAGHISVLAVQ